MGNSVILINYVIISFLQVPRDSNVSQECKDLLLSLLKRDPKERITFEEFFAHPFLDLEHAASASSLTKAVCSAFREIN